MSKKGFPTFAVIVLVLAIAWLLNEIGVVNVHVPWIPLIIAIWALGAIVNHYQK